MKLFINMRTTQQQKEEAANRPLRLQQSACQGKIQQGRAVCPQTGGEVSGGVGEGVALSKKELPPHAAHLSPHRLCLRQVSSSQSSTPLTAARAISSAPPYLPQISFNFSGHFLSVSFLQRSLSDTLVLPCDICFPR